MIAGYGLHCHFLKTKMAGLQDQPFPYLLTLEKEARFFYRQPDIGQKPQRLLAGLKLVHPPKGIPLWKRFLSWPLPGHRLLSLISCRKGGGLYIGRFPTFTCKKPLFLTIKERRLPFSEVKMSGYAIMNENPEGRLATCVTFSREGRIRSP